MLLREETYNVLPVYDTYCRHTEDDRLQVHQSVHDVLVRLETRVEATFINAAKTNLDRRSASMDP